ncbi:hypothetical protein [Teredinibacter turnerae]|uniref:hypothetical protein n=1 Tax=Teredinibacter turnerae TaxID=2426 RepID=UPI0003FA6674|nr:hypothetical protein [Teredinibacter turnerae]
MLTFNLTVPVKRFLHGIALSLVAACGSDNVQAPYVESSPTPMPPPDPGNPTESRDEAERQLLEDIARQLDASACNNVTEDCAQTIATFRAPPTDTTVSTHILVLDWGIHPVALTGYRNRVLATYELSTSLVAEEVFPSQSMASDLDTVFNLIAEHPYFVSISAYRTFREHPSRALFDQLTAQTPLYGHGYFITTFLMEYNPEAQFVLVDLGASDKHLITPEGSCAELLATDPVANSQALEIIEGAYTSYLATIQDLVARHKIDYINASWGSSAIGIAEQISQVCGDVADRSVVDAIQKIDRDFIRALSQLSYTDQSSQPVSTILVQAGANRAGRDLEIDDPDYLTDCDSHQLNRVRVQAVENNGIEPLIPEWGTQAVDAIKPASIAYYKNCTDLFVSLGIYQDSSLPPGYIYAIRDKGFHAYLHGFVTEDFFPGFLSSSFAPPVVISALNFYQQQTTERLSLDELLARLAPNGPIIDPLLYDHFRVYSEGYRAD